MGLSSRGKTKINKSQYLPSKIHNLLCLKFKTNVAKINFQKFELSYLKQESVFWIPTHATAYIFLIYRYFLKFHVLVTKQKKKKSSNRNLKY